MEIIALDSLHILFRCMKWCLLFKLLNPMKINGPKIKFTIVGRLHEICNITSDSSN
jgi:hypothetical protein